MNIQPKAVAILLSSLVLFSAGCSNTGLNVSSTGEGAPVIRNVTGADDPVQAGGSVTLNAVIEDAEGDPLTINWTSEAGRFVEASGETATWEAPRSTGTYTLYVTAIDATGASSVASIPITVDFELPEDATVKLRLLETVKRSDVDWNDDVFLEVVEPVVVNGITVIEAGTLAVAGVAKAEEDASRERSDLALYPDALQRVDGGVAFLRLRDAQLPEGSEAPALRFVDKYFIEVKLDLDLGSGDFDLDIEDEVNLPFSSKAILLTHPDGEIPKGTILISSFGSATGLDVKDGALVPTQWAGRPLIAASPCPGEPAEDTNVTTCYDVKWDPNDAIAQ